MKRLLFLNVFYCLSIVFTLAQTTNVKGKVVDESTNEALIGVNVSIPGTTIGTVTSSNGEFVLLIPSEAKELVFSYVGYELKIVNVSKQSMLVTLASTIKSIDEVIVVAYGTELAKNLTGSVTHVKAGALQRSAEISPIKGLVGNTSGVRISTADGSPGSAVSIQVRGINSINGSKAPLYVIDGIPVKNGNYSKVLTSSDIFNLVSSDDIESINVLKDAAASSLYGSRAANGVILINTKKGSVGKSKWTIKYEYGVSDFAKPNRLENFLNGSEYTEYAFEGLKNRWLNYYNLLPGTPGVDMESEAWKEKLVLAENYAFNSLHSTGGIIHPDDDLSGTFNYANLTDKQKQRYFTHARNTNWLDEWFQKGKTEKININTTGGTDKFNYYFSLGSDKQEGVIPHSEFSRLSSKLSLNIKPNKKLTFNYNQSLGYSEKIGQTTGAWYYASPLFAIYGANPTTPAKVKDADGNWIDNEHCAFEAKIYNPKSIYGKFDKSQKQYRYLGNAKVAYKFTPWLSMSSTNAVDFIYIDESDITKPNHPDAAADQGWINYYRRTVRTFTTSNLLNFNKSFQNHNVDALIGYEAMKHDKDYILASGTNFASDKLMYLSNAAKPSSVGGTLQEDMLLSYLGQVKYNWRNKYFLSGSLRRDGSGRLSKDKMWGNFYSISGAWNIKGESFMDAYDWLDLLKIRASYGTSGKLPTGYYDSQALYSVAGAYNGQPTIEISQIANNQLTWEISKTFNIGFDYSLFDRLSGSVEYYLKNTDGLLNDVPISWITGFSSLQLNKGGIRNNGLEFDVNYSILKNTDIKWDMNVNGTLMRATITDLDEPIEAFPYQYEKGLSLYSFKLREWAGVNPANGMPMWFTNSEIIDDNGKIVEPSSAYENPFGGGRFVTSNPSHAEKAIVGNSIPDIYGGITNTLEYKGFDLSFLMTYSLGADLYNSDYSWQNSDGAYIGSYNLLKSSLDYWKKPGDQAANPIVIYGAPHKSNYNSDRRLVSGDYLKLKNLELGYSLPTKWINKLKLSSCRLYLNATDLFLISADENFNPEVDLSGSSQSVENFPAMRTYRFGINVQF